MRRLIVFLAVSSVLLAAAPSAFADVTVTVSESALGQTLMGTATGSPHTVNAPGRCPSGQTAVDADWAFTGQLNGNGVGATGVWQGCYTGTQYKGAITSFTSWTGNWCTKPVEVFGKKIPACFGGPLSPPGTPRGFDVTAGSLFVTVGFNSIGTISFPLVAQGSGYDSRTSKTLPAPDQNVVLSVTNMPGVQAMLGLPRTGAAPDFFSLVAGGFIVIGVALLGSAAWLYRRRRTA